MTDTPEPEKTRDEMLDAIRKMMSQFSVHTPQNESKPSSEEDPAAKRRRDVLSFDFKPKDIKKHLDRFVIKQEDAKRVLATAVCDHYRHVQQCKDPAKCRSYSKQNVIMLGPTGVGKTYLIRSLSELVGVPFVKADATKFSETGYVGGDVEDLIRELVHKADGDIALAEWGIVYLDEIDKIASSSQIQGRDVSGSGVQRNLLKIMEETEVALRNPQDIQSQMQAMMEFQKKGRITRQAINTRHILFIVSGAFADLGQVIEKRLRVNSIGFRNDTSEPIADKQLYSQVRTDDFIKYGFEPEFVGRLPVRVICEALNSEDLYRILTTSEGSILKQIGESFAAYGIQFHYEEAALWEIAKQAAEEGTGARGLVTLCERIFRSFKYELPSSKIRLITLTRQMVDNPKAVLSELLQEEMAERRKVIEEEVRLFEKNFSQKHGVTVRFSEAATRRIQDTVMEQELETLPYLESLLSNYAYGLGLIQKMQPRPEFVLESENMTNPNAVLENWIREAYGGQEKP